MTTLDVGLLIIYLRSRGRGVLCYKEFLRRQQKHGAIFQILFDNNFSALGSVFGTMLASLF